MTFMVLAILAAIALVSFVLYKNSKVSEKSDEVRTGELLSKARYMFPTAENDIYRLDALYQFNFREMLIAEKAGYMGWEELRRDSILIFNAKNRAIKASVQFEESVNRKFIPTTHGRKVTHG